MRVLVTRLADVHNIANLREGRPNRGRCGSIQSSLQTKSSLASCGGGVSGGWEEGKEEVGGNRDKNKAGGHAQLTHLSPKHPSETQDERKNTGRAKRWPKGVRFGRLVK